MIDIVRDYVAIGLGGVQAVTTEVVGAGRTGVDRVASRIDLPDGMAGLPTVEVRSVLDRGRGVVDGLRRTDVDAVASRLGLAKKSEVHAVRQQIHRLERRLGEVRRER